MRRSNARVPSASVDHPDTTKQNNPRMEKANLKFRPLRSTNLFSRNPKPQSPLTRSNLFLFAFLTLAFLSSSFFYFHSPSPFPNRYSILIDAGSTGSRIHVFHYSLTHNAPLFDFTTNYNAFRVTPGLSAFLNDPHAAAASVSDMLDFGRKAVPKQSWGTTEVRLMATAGLRMLDFSVQEKILEACRSVLRRSGFLFRDHWASVISGSDEGVHAWVVANYALGTLGGDPHETTGIIELGGASAQVTFFSTEPMPPEFSRTVKFGNVSYSLYSHSLLEFGQNVAFDLVRRSNLAKVPNPESSGSKVLLDPCSPKGYKHNLITGNITPSSLIEKDEQLSILHASGNFSECRSASLTLLQKGKEECAYDQCYIGSTFTPKLQGKFLATENFFHTSKFFGLSQKTFLSELMVAGKQFCEEDWSKLKSKYPKFNDEDLHRYCFSSAYIVALLHDSLGIAFDDTRIAYANQVNNIPLDWALGAFILQIMSELDVEQLQPPKSIITMDYSILSGLIIVIILLFAAYYVSKWRKPNVKTIFDLEKGKYIVTRVGRQS